MILRLEKFLSESHTLPGPSAYSLNRPLTSSATAAHISARRDCLTKAVASKLKLGWGSAKFNETNIGVPKRALNLIGAEVSLTYAPNHRFYLRPHFEFTHISDGRLRRHLVSPSVGNFGLALGINL